VFQRHRHGTGYTISLIVSVIFVCNAEAAVETSETRVSVQTSLAASVAASAAETSTPHRTIIIKPTPAQTSAEPVG